MDGNVRGVSSPVSQGKTTSDGENVERRMFSNSTSGPGDASIIGDRDEEGVEDDDDDQTSTQAICLRGWKGARVLARVPNQDTFLSGCLKTIRRNGRDIGVQFDGFQDGTLTFYNDVLESKRLDVIGDQIPAPSEVRKFH